MASYEPHHEIPLSIFGIAAATLSIEQLLSLNIMSASNLAAIVAMVAAIVATLTLVRFWRHN